MLKYSVAALAFMLTILGMYFIAGPGAEWASTLAQTDGYIMPFLGCLTTVAAFASFFVTLAIFERKD